MPADIEREVLRHLRAAGVGPEQRVAVGCSGGPDSAALAAATSALVGAGQLAGATAIYIDHGLRAASAEDGVRVAELARRLGLAFRSERVVVEPGASREAAAREARYRALEAIAHELGGPFVLLAHTASDQAETVLMRTVRGTGVRGLAGIPWRRGRYLRPLLGVPRAAIERYLAARNIPALEDPTNRDPAFSRNRFRHHWLPALAAENPRVEEALARLADAAGESRQVLEFAAESLLEKSRDEGSGALDAAALARAPDPVVARALGREAERKTGSPLTARHLRALETLLRRSAGGSAEIALPGGRAIREYDRLVFEGSASPAPTPRPAITLQGAQGPYLVRTWRAGDRMRPARLKGRSRKLSDLYIDAKIPKRLRDRARVVVREADGVIQWAEHLGAAYGAEIEVTLTPPEQVTSNRG